MNFVMNYALGQDQSLDLLASSFTGSATTCANGMHIVMNHTPGAGSIARPVD